GHPAGGHAAGGHPAGGHAAGGHAAGGHDQHGAPGHAHGDAGPADDRGLSLLTSGHDHGTGEVVALDAATQATLDDQLAATGEVIDRYPTAADALAAGFTRQGPFTPGLGTHYIAPATQPVVGTVDRAELSTPVLVYDGPGPDAPLAGLMYTSRSTRAAPEGFAGPNDHWHQHEDVCVVPRAGGGADTPFGVDRGDVTAAMCAGVGGEWIRRIQYMVHVWTVPGHENPDGVFAEVNPAITCPDGTYHEVDWREIGTRTSTCRSG
ncbi:MAG TPA: hypothetical protein VFI47_12260, partial [Acidimicrobiales bacterium]|nr:hypothetical protein [Acidimicrobiales bacterium]